MLNIFQKFTANSKNALKNAFGLALASGHKTVTPQHILYGLSQQRGSIAAQILAKVNIDSEEIKQKLTAEQNARQTLTQISLAGATKKVLEKAFLIASLNQHKYIGTEHLLASLLSTRDSLTSDFFEQKGIIHLIQKIFGNQCTPCCQYFFC